MINTKNNNHNPHNLSLKLGQLYIDYNRALLCIYLFFNKKKADVHMYVCTYFRPDYKHYLFMYKQICIVQICT